MPPVGSGVVQFDERATGESLLLRRFDDHFLRHQPTPAIPDTLASGVAFDELSVRVVPSGHAAVQLLSADEADATAMRIPPDTVPRVGQADTLDLHVADGDECYHVGYNTQRPPLGNPHVRRAISRLLDKRHIVETIFDGYARPVATPLASSDWTPSDLVWDGSDPEVPFVGTAGVLDEQAARTLFKDAGLTYSDNGKVLAQ
jgi:peptide/nickel transport system substrate-binding protein